MLYPRTNAKRLAIRLDGIRQFHKDPQDVGRRENWAACAPQGTIPMPVPGAFNEMTSDPALRDYYGVVWYFLKFEPPAAGERHLLRFGAAVYGSDIFLNGRHVGAGQPGKLPFEIDVTGKLQAGANTLAVRIDTSLDWQTIPPGTVKTLAPTWSTPNVHGPQESPRPEYHFDFLNYGGLLRSVWLLALPASHIEHLRVETIAHGDKPAGLRVGVSVHGACADVPAFRLLAHDGTCVATAHGGQDLLPDDPRL